jgi:hypothetical protein
MPNKSNLTIDAERVIGEISPIDVADPVAYQEYLRLSKMPILNEGKMITVSTGKKLSLGTLDHRLKELIRDLPAIEQKQILAKRKIYNTLLCKKNGYMRKAYGSIVDKRGNLTVKGTVLEPRAKEIIELFGRMFTIAEVHEIVVKEFKIPCGQTTIGDFRVSHAKEIDRRIEEHKRTFTDIRLGYKRSRLEELQYLYRTRKRIYEVSKKAEDHKLLLQTLEQIRKEVEGDSIRIDGNLNFNLEQTIEQHIHLELFNNFSLKEIIMGRVAAKSGKAPEKLLMEMNKSYYGRFIQTQDIDHEVLPDFPSNQPYDFDRIRREQQQIANAPVPLQERVNVIDSEQVNTIKQLLLAKLNSSAEKVNHVKNSLGGRFIEKENS